MSIYVSFDLIVYGRRSREPWQVNTISWSRNHVRGQYSYVQYFFLNITICYICTSNLRWCVTYEFLETFYGATDIIFKQLVSSSWNIHDIYTANLFKWLPRTWRYGWFVHEQYSLWAYASSMVESALFWNLHFLTISCCVNHFLYSVHWCNYLLIFYLFLQCKQSLYWINPFYNNCALIWFFMSQIAIPAMLDVVDADILLF